MVKRSERRMHTLIVEGGERVETQHSFHEGRRVASPEQSRKAFNRKGRKERPQRSQGYLAKRYRALRPSRSLGQKLLLREARWDPNPNTELPIPDTQDLLFYIAGTCRAVCVEVTGTGW
jgi:hypothetical protein